MANLESRYVVEFMRKDGASLRPRAFVMTCFGRIPCLALFGKQNATRCVKRFWRQGVPCRMLPMQEQADANRD